MPRTSLDIAAGSDVLASWVSERADQTAHAATAEIWTEVPAYRRLADNSLRAEVEAHARQVVAAFLASVLERRDPLPRDFPWTASHAMRRVELGIALPDFMSGFRTGQLTLWDDILEGVKARPDAQVAALHIARQVMRTIEVASTTASVSYLEAQQYRMADRARVARDLLEDLLDGRPPVVSQRRRALIALGLDEDVSLVVVAGRLGASGPGVESLRRMLSSSRAGLFVARQDEVVAVLPVTDPTAERLVTAVQGTLALLAAQDIFPTVGMSGIHTGWLSVPTAYAEAEHARRSLGASPGLKIRQDMSTLDFLVHSQGEEGAGLVRPAIRSFLDEDQASGGVFVDTLRAFVAANLNAKEAALALFVHPNTVYYRLERIAERTGCDVRCVEELIDLLVAVRLVRGS